MIEVATPAMAREYTDFLKAPHPAAMEAAQMKKMQQSYLRAPAG